MELPREVGSKQNRGLVYSLQALFEKYENINTLIQSRLNVRMVNQEFNQHNDLLKLFLDTHYQYHSKFEDSQQKGRG